jgi:hypothetical protein
MTQRRHRSAAFLLAVLGSALGAGTAAAQYQAPAPVPLGPLEPTPAGGAPNNPGVAAPAGLVVPAVFGSGWDKQFVVGGAWENNVGFVTPTGPDDFFGSLQASLAYWLHNTRQTLRLTFDGDGAVYAQLHDHNRLYGSGTVNWTSRLSQETSLTLGGAAASAHSDTQDILVGQGIVLPPVRTTSGNAHLGLTTRLGQRTNATIDGSWQKITFDSTLYLPTTDWTAGLNLSRTLSPQDTLTARGAYRLSVTTASRRQLPSFELDLAHRLQSGLAISLGAGAGHEDVTPLGSTVTPATASWQFNGTAGLAGRIHRTTLSAVYSHGLQATPTLVYNEVVDVLTLSLTMPVGRWWQVLAGGAGSYRRQPQAGALAYRTTDMFAGVSRTIGREASVALEYRFRSRSQPSPAPLIRNDRASASLIWSPGRSPGPATVPAR